MLSLFILIISSVAVFFLLLQLFKAGKKGKFLETLRDLLIIFLAILMTGAIFYIGFRFFRNFF
tara:strand:+ start:3219 stop:3407 length:189 start_codon:yes stop_codon:yes gene_type:complete